jgi:hypothetical protein
MSIDVCTEYDLLLAAEDFVPVALAGVGCLVLAELAARSVPAVGLVARLGGAMIVLGGLSKAVWKLLVAGPCVEIPILEQALFPLLAAGFLALSWALLSVVRDRVMPWWSFALVYALGVAGAFAAGSTKPLLAVAALGALALAAYGVRLGQRADDKVAIRLFVVYALATFVLPPLAARPEQTLGAQWAEQLTNTLAQAAFAYAAWRLLRNRRTPVVRLDRTLEAHS